MTTQLESRKIWLKNEIETLKEWLFENREHPERIEKFRLKLQYEQELNGSRELSNRFKK